MQLDHYIGEDLLEKFEFHNYNHALEILTEAFPEQWANIVQCLRELNITTDEEVISHRRAFPDIQDVLRIFTKAHD